MNEELYAMESDRSQKVERGELAAKASGAILMLLVSIGLMLGAKAGNMALSLVWPVLLLPILSSVKTLGVVLCRVTGCNDESAPVESVQGVM